ncbi:MAG: histidine kinase [Sphingopyxis sp.]|uniref:sensor histidine kinase n=1 Tax=Sphingopyxis sp. TaxID=1908224 RepID=UPI002ABB1B6A|nr:histidine kinase [Sphingopyxis sp.]MDZ3832323.1 histidine kinase [Sphingopyxis sp.]
MPGTIETTNEYRLTFQLTAILWLASSSVITIGAIFAGQMRSPSEYLSVPFTVCTAAGITMLLYVPTRLLQNKRAAVILPAVLAAIILATMLQTAADYGMHLLFQGIFPDHVMPDASLSSLAVVGSIYFALFSCNAALLWLSLVAQVSKSRQLALTQAKLNLAMAESRRAQAELRMLRLQLDPHFMVNSLSAISTLAMTGDAPGAAGIADRLADFLRLTLDQSDWAEQSLSDEIALTAAYLDIERVRFGDRLKVQITCPDPLQSALVPHFLLQPLVENAMKYGFGTSIGTMTLLISARQEQDCLILAVEDLASTRCPHQPPPGLGIGLANTRERLEALYGSQARLSTAVLDQGFRSEISLPIHFDAPHGAARAQSSVKVPGTKIA